MRSQLLQRGSRIASVPVILAVALLCCAAVGVAFVEAGYSARERFATASMPRFLAADWYSSEAARVRELTVFDTVDSRAVMVELLQPLVADAPLPPGIKEWPAPGEFLVSPDLVDNVADISHRWGTYAGVLDDAALGSSHERLIYVHSLADLGEENDASGFGTGSEPVNNIYYEPKMPRAMGLICSGFALVVPAGLLLLACLAQWRAQGSRRMRVVEVLGADPRKLHRESMIRLLPSIGLGVLLGAIPFVAFLVPVPLPWAEHVVRPVDVRAVAGVIVAAWLCGGLVSLLLAWVASLPATRLDTRQRPVDPGWLTFTLGAVGAIGVVVCGQQGYAAANTAASGGQDATVIWLAVGLLIGLVTMRAMAECALWVVGAALISLGRRTSSGTSLLVGRSLISSRRMSWIAAVAGSLVLLTGVAMTWAYSGSIPAVQAQRIIDRIDGRFATVKAPNPIVHDREVVQAFPSGTQYLGTQIQWVYDSETFDEEEESMSIWGSPSALERFALAPGMKLTRAELDPLLASQLLISDDTSSIEVSTEPPVGYDIAPVEDTAGDQMTISFVSYMVFNTDGSRVDVSELKRAVGQAGGYMWMVRYGGEEEIIGAHELVHTLRWVPWFVVIGTFLLLMALWVRTAEAQRRQSMTLTPVDAVFARTPRGPTVLVVALVITATVAALIGGGSAGLLARMADSDLSISGGALPVVAVTTAAVFALIITVGIPASLRQLRLTRAWILGSSDD